MIGEFILLLGEDARLLKALADPLEASGYQAFAVDSVSEALLVLRTVRARVLVVDGEASFSRGPAMAGLLAAHPEIKEVPVIALTAGNPADKARSAQEAGCAACLSRSVSARTLLETVRRWIGSN